jgi:hypothetical protein
VADQIKSIGGVEEDARNLDCRNWRADA